VSLAGTADVVTRAAGFQLQAVSFERRFDLVLAGGHLDVHGEPQL